MFFVTAGDSIWLPEWSGNTYIQNYGYRFGRVDVKSDDELNQAYCQIFSKAEYNFDISNYINTVLYDTSAEVVVVFE